MWSPTGDFESPASACSATSAFLYEQNDTMAALSPQGEILTVHPLGAVKVFSGGRARRSGFDAPAARL